jgi:feruloyl esterase
MAGGPEPFTIADDYFKYVVFKDLSWDFRTFDFDKDVAFTDRADGGAINATDPNLTPFFGRGGKILMYHGWADQLIAPQNSIDYLRRVDAAVGAARAAASIRLFMVPGMAHCGGGPGPTTFDAIGALETWVEQKRAPDVLPAAHETNGKPDRTRPICAYPNVATYNGSGDANDAANFRCRPPH